MATRNRKSPESLAPVVRCCGLCGQPKAIQPINEEHRRAHLARQIAFVCPECAAQVRTAVEAAGDIMERPRTSA